MRFPFLRSALALVAVALLLLVTGTARAQITTYATRTDFNIAFPGLPVEDFEEARVPNGAFAQMANPLDQFTNNAVFSPGEILGGLRITVGSSAIIGPNNLFVGGAGFANYTSKAISYNGGDTTSPEITLSFFNGNVTAFGLDLTSTPNGNNVTLSLFSGTANLGSFTVNNVQGAGTFFGASSASAPITSVTLTSLSNFFGVDNIAFPATPSADIPEPGTLALLLAGTLTTGAGFLRRRRA